MRASKLLFDVIKVGRMTKVPVYENCVPRLKELYQTTLTKLETLPSDSFYRKATTAITLNRYNLIQQTEDPQVILEKLERLQMEQLVLEAEDELKLIDKVKEMKIWEPLTEKAPVDQYE
ncbi:NADH dehydrogenase 1 alpha subcomplex subunit 5-like protein [Neoconidiobolus thromboides FSU 785]|nr:NADH dehydrogenase 1 alpha subcomplex subunit 5-like protein [Neoconidiobolus thromboides FSU 785]